MQHGFQRHRSCVSNLLLTLNDWTQADNEGGCIHACYLDFSKAFDKVNHGLLLQKLEHYGIRGPLLAWLEDYLSNRQARVRVDGILSREVRATSGVPQGSVLGPVLFLIYINDLPPLVQCRIILFADDAKLWMRIKNVSDCALLQRDLRTLYDWSISNGLPFNIRKCKVLSIGKNVEFQYTLGSQHLEWSQAEKDLGVWICRNLKPGSHCEII